MCYHKKKGNVNRVVDFCIRMELRGGQWESNHAHIDTAVLLILVDKVSYGFIDPHFINMLYNLHTLSIVCVSNIILKIYKNKLNR